jgi:hypothetical protein
MGEGSQMRDPELVARAGYAAARLEQAWERWRVLHGLDGSADPLASYVGYSHKEPMGKPRVVIGVDAAEAEFFADFLESHDCSRPGGTLGPDPGAEHPATSPPAAPAPVDRVFPAAVATFTPEDSPDVMAAELAGWASGELPGQASAQLASWAAADGPGVGR